MAEKEKKYYGEGSEVRLIGSTPTYDIYQRYNPVGESLSVTSGGTYRISGSGTSTGDIGRTTIQKTTPSETVSTSITDPSTTTTESKWSPTKPLPTLGDTVTADLPEAPVLPEFDVPEMGEMPEFVAPEWDESAIAALSQKKAAPGIRGLREAYQRVAARRDENPNVTSMTLRQALRGYGTGLEEIMSGAYSAAESEYGKKYAVESEEAKINYQTAVQTIRDVYSGKLHAADSEFKANVNSIMTVYGAEVAASVQAAADENYNQRAVFEASLNDYLKSGTTTTTSQTTGGKVTSTSKTTGGTTTQVSQPGVVPTFSGGTTVSPTSGGTSDYQQRVYAAKKAALNSLSYNNPLRARAEAELAAMATSLGIA